jgi:hypothetical protein
VLLLWRSLSNKLISLSHNPFNPGRRLGAGPGPFFVFFVPFLPEEHFSTACFRRFRTTYSVLLEKITLHLGFIVAAVRKSDEKTGGKARCG